MKIEFGIDRSWIDGLLERVEGCSPALLEAAAHGVRAALLDQSGSPLYWLVRKALTPRDPRALPPATATAAAAVSAVLDAIDAILRGLPPQRP